ncbi:putative ribonuclease H-like domain-containing protein [Tanacetum coccineum]|uniref:Ribonuclease H-like domain-containing protein n=1 Tax=Tanacetum coccineum TaxID=301880 RepID=A0ABQ5CYJ8_9ASTR
MNKIDERGIVIKNKARLIAQGYTQEEGIDYDEVFAHVSRIKAIRLFLAYASFKDFVVYQMDVKSAFLYGKIEEEVYVCQPLGFEDPDFLDRRGKIDKTLFIRRDKGDILLVQVYVDDIIFGSTKKSLCTEFEKTMHWKFQMSSLGELTFFLGLQVKQKEDGIFISQDKYATEILKKFGFTDVKTASTPMDTQKPLLKDEDGEEVDVHLYRSMIGSLMYLTSLRPDIMFAVCACARYQVNPKVSHLHAMKRFFRYLKGQPKLGIWYPKDSPFDLVAYTDSDYIGASLDRKSTTGGCQFLRCRLILWQCKKQNVDANSITEVEYVAASSCCGQVKTINGEVHIQALVDNKKVIITEISVRSDLQLYDTEVKKLEGKRKSKPPGMKILFKIGRSTQVVSSEDEGLGDQEDASKQGRKIANIDADVEVTLVDETQGRNDEEMFDTCILNDEELFAKQDVVEKETSIEIKVAKPKTVTTAATTTTTAFTRPKARGVVVQEPSEFTITTSPSQPSQLPQVKDKGKPKMVEPEKPLKKKDQIIFDKEVAQKIQAQLDAELE